MKNFLVTFSCPEGQRQNVINHIRSYPFWARINPYSWIVQSDQNTVEIRNQIKLAVPSIDSILVIGIDNANWATSSVAKEVTDWMKDNI